VAPAHIAGVAVTTPLAIQGMEHLLLRRWRRNLSRSFFGYLGITYGPFWQRMLIQGRREGMLVARRKRVRDNSSASCSTGCNVGFLSEEEKLEGGIWFRTWIVG
jgi:hypothetical protein